MLEQQKSNSWTPVGPTKDRASSPNQRYSCIEMFLAGAFITSEARPTGMQLKREIVNRDWVNHQARTLSHKNAVCRITGMLYPVLL